MTLTDVWPAMLSLSRTINSECAHIPGDMHTLRLRRLDAVFVHDAICYTRTQREMLAAMRTAAEWSGRPVAAT